MIASDDASEDEWTPSSGDEAKMSPKRTRKSKRSQKPVNYCNEKIDKQFEEYPGMTNFGRTHKGGDRRPRAVGKASSMHACMYDTGCC